MVNDGPFSQQIWTDHPLFQGGVA